MWSLTQRLGVSIAQSLHIFRAVTAPAVSRVQSFSGLSRLPSSPRPHLGVAGVINDTTNQLLKPATSPLVQLANGFKIKGRLKRRCQDCYFVVRQERMYVMCKSHGRHKQMAMKKSEKNSWILTDATQSKFRAW